MCNIGKNQERPDSFFPAEALRSVKPVASVSFAGGEPFLHANLVDLVRVVHENNPAAKIIFSSNGFRTDSIVKAVQEVSRFHDNTQVTLSLDGVEDMHDRGRGIPGAREKVNATFDRLGEIGLKKRNFGFTISADNVSELPAVYAHTKKKRAGLSIGVAQSSKFLNVDAPCSARKRCIPT